ncbi:hypothetical protein HTZ84_21070 [Haloterrigena sp. SYSU A558-1]|uniref:Uncharacterized protein n=1 Tax=Haloterrigena gelatinilytica TaxID=2741724 RepID=A0ABX2LER7_9EURY|nr:hypothetical protein [Haloterrigena gelatinilytica]NUC74757.1 hypothetical protein [Haloterrigena gelatinilytica]
MKGDRIRGPIRMGDVFIVDEETLAEAVKKAGYAYQQEHGYGNRASDFNLYLQAELPRFIKQVGEELGEQ